jgi:4-hydroxy-tetrahydrodipicolinate reductase
MNLAIVGLGRMGRAVEEAASARGHRVLARIGREVDLSGARDADVAIEFTRPDQVERNVTALVEMGIPTVCGTTGWNPAGAESLANARGVPLLVAANFSIGMAALQALASIAAQRLAAFPEFEPGIFERHHSQKADSPSGSAKLLASAVAAGSGRDRVPIAALRQGSQPGEHTVHFEGGCEELLLTHRVRSRSVFATGAIAAAEWIVRTRPTGAVRFEDFLERSRP